MSSDRQLLAWKELDLGPQWVRRRPPPTAAPVDSPLLRHLEPPLRITGLDQDQDQSQDQGQDTWQQVADEVAGCVKCGLSESRRRTVFGAGSQAARWLLVGEAPKADEDASGDPFVGTSGRLLDQMLAAIGLSRGDVFITNLLKCRPPGDRDPAPVEANTCAAYLRRQIDLLQPDLILLLGEAAVQGVLQSQAALAEMRGRVHGFNAAHGEIPVVCTHHPDYLLRNLAHKKESWEDLCLAVEVAARQQSLRLASAAGG